MSSNNNHPASKTLPFHPTSIPLTCTQHDGSPYSARAKRAHAHELFVTHWQVLAIDALTVAAVIHIRIVQIYKLVVAPCYQYPMRGLQPGESVVTDQYHWFESSHKCCADIKIGSLLLYDARLRQILSKAVFYQLHDGLFFRTAYALQKQRAKLANHQTHLKTAPTGS